MGGAFAREARRLGAGAHPPRGRAAALSWAPAGFAAFDPARTGDGHDDAPPPAPKPGPKPGRRKAAAKDEGEPAPDAAPTPEAASADEADPPLNGNAAEHPAATAGPSPRGSAGDGEGGGASLAADENGEAEFDHTPGGDRARVPAELRPPALRRLETAARRLHSRVLLQEVAMLRRAAVPCLCFCLFAASARAQWRALPSVDDLTGERMVVALADGAYGRMRMLADCRDGFYILALGFTGDAVLADGTVTLAWGEDGPIERHYWQPDDDGEVAYVTTWPGEDAGGVRYDPLALGFFENLRRYPYVELQATQYPATAVNEHFYLTGAPEALDALNCPHR